jgi:hypothetical protein
MNYEQKYLKYKNKYFRLKKQLGGDPFYFSVYVFTFQPLDEARKTNMINLLTQLYGEPIGIVTSAEESPLGGFFWREAVRYIEDKSTIVSYYKTLTHITSFVINNVPRELETKPMNDTKLTVEEYKIREQLNNFGLNTSLSMPIIKGGKEDPDFSEGWGFWSDGSALITLVESNKEK